MKKHFSLGIDIGTTTICGAVVDVEKKQLIESFTKKNDSWIDNGLGKTQDSDIILSVVNELLVCVLEKYNISNIGITGQMHGIVYFDEEGFAVSPLYTWQNEYGSQKINDTDKTYCEEISNLTGYKITTGYGFATHYYLQKNKMIANNAKSFCTIMDYITMRICNLNKPFCHSSNAASIGLFDIKNQKFDVNAINKISFDLKLPSVTSKCETIGLYKDIPVSNAIGDNQASVLGTIGTASDKILVNFGTGSQISAIIKNYVEINGLETRPYINGNYLLVGSALCGGRAYAIVERFFREYYFECVGKDVSQYETMNKLAKLGYENKSSMKVHTQFCGNREKADMYGKIENITDSNFLPSNMIFGTILGMVNELYNMYEKMNLKGITKAVASGNAVKQNSVLLDTIKDVFMLDTSVMEYDEEAAFGAAMFAEK